WRWARVSICPDEARTIVTDCGRPGYVRQPAEQVKIDQIRRPESSGEISASAAPVLINCDQPGHRRIHPPCHVTSFSRTIIRSCTGTSCSNRQESCGRGDCC